MSVFLFKIKTKFSDLITFKSIYGAAGKKGTKLRKRGAGPPADGVVQLTG